MIGIKRNLALKLLEMLDLFPVVVVLGARQTGKTTLCLQVKPDWKYMDLEDPASYEYVARDSRFFLQEYPEHVIFDEAQEYPELFNVLRGVVDSHRHQKGRFILTGSSSPELKDHISQTLAGRVGIIELGTLKANEYYGLPLSAFYQIFDQELSREFVVGGSAPLEVSQMQHLWLRGGYPEPVLDQNDRFYTMWMQNYHDTYINRDLSKLFPRLNKLNYRRFLTILGKLSGTIINKRDVARALEVSEGTVREYISIAEGTFLWRSLPSYEHNVIKAVIKMPKGYVRDSGLFHYLVRITSLESLQCDPLVGVSFESFVIEEIIKGLEALWITNWTASYYRTRAGAEIDLILEGPFGILPIEIKQGMIVTQKQLRSLHEFIEEHQLPFGLVINQSHSVQWLSPKVVQIPIGWL